ncbi:MAG: NAD(P)-binding domain-containing protein [Desulfobacterales bacterium]
MKLGFIGFGVAAYGLSKGLKEAGVEGICFFDSNYRNPLFQEVFEKRIAETGAAPSGSLGELIGNTDVVLSCVTGSVSVSVAKEASEFLSKNHIYIDVNSASPMVKKDVYEAIEKTGAGFVDGAIMGPVPAFLHQVPIFVSGDGADRFREMMAPYGMQITCIGSNPGDASALKMLRSIFMKGIAALLMEMLPAARHFGSWEMVVDSIAKTIESRSFLETVRTIFPKALVGAERMSNEMNDVVETLNDAGFPSELTQAVRNKLLWCSDLQLMERFKGQIPESIEEAIEALNECATETGNCR